MDKWNSSGGVPDMRWVRWPEGGGRGVLDGGWRWQSTVEMASYILKSVKWALRKAVLHNDVVSEGEERGWNDGGSPP